jgi:DedD protein
MDRGLKERLVGAAVLVALGVWLVPWVLDGPGRGDRPESEALELPAPTASTPLRSHTITLDNDHEPPTPAVSTLGFDHAVATPIPQQARDTSSPPIRSAAVSAAGTQGLWFVQIGSYADEENARRQADRVSTYGFDARLSTYLAGGRSMQRVRIGPQASRENALAVASALSTHGFVAQVVH